MRPETLAALYDLRSSLTEITELLPNPADMLHDRVKGLAVERLLMIVGEAMTRIRDLEPPVFQKFPEGQAVIATRNVIVHAYDRIDPKRLVDGLSEDLPILLKRVTALIAVSDEVTD